MSNRRRAKKSDIDKQLSNWSRRRILSWSLFGLAGLVAVQHLLAHAGLRPVPLSMGWQDVLIGYPTAIVLAIIGAIALDPNPRI
ncbi:hypothetical protein [Nocardioides taihuensis]|jgi:hypothetical protein|uniref:Uncharacterized protein n=1 Tax=Nocardioides taihuensis TaxID=1835606 RepID=A0ABW0BDS4_9ACTN